MEIISRANKIKKIVKTVLFLIVSPLFISVIANLLFSLASPYPTALWLWLMSLLIFLIWGFLLLVSFTKMIEGLLNLAAIKLRARRFVRPRILILNGNLDCQKVMTPPPYFTDKNPEDWATELKKLRYTWKIELGCIEQIYSENPDIVINPFGEVYPEEDLSLHTTFTRIRDYVHAGGVYVNVAGYPFYYQYNDVNKKLTEAGRFEKESQDPDDHTYIIKPLITDVLGIEPKWDQEQKRTTKQDDSDRYRFGELAGAGGTPETTIFRFYPKLTPNMLPMLYSEDKENIIIGSVAYGLGHFIFAGLIIKDNNTGFEKVIASIIGWAKFESGS